MREYQTAHKSLRAACFTAFPAFLAVAAIFLAFYGSSVSFFQDESYVVWLAGPGLRHIAQYIGYEPHPPLYHAILTLWISLACDSEHSVRALSGIFYLLALATIASMGRSLFRRDELILILVLVACCPVLLQAADFGRMFTLTFFESCVAFLAFSSVFLRRTAGAGAGAGAGAAVLLVVANLAGMFTHYYFAFVMAAEAIVFLVFVRRQWLTAALALVLPGALFLALWGPRLIDQLRTDRFAGNLAAPFPSVGSELYGYYGKRWIFVLLSLSILFLVSLSGRRFVWRRWPAVKANLLFAIRDRRLLAFAIIWATTFAGPFLAATVAGTAFWKGGMTYLPTMLPLTIVLALFVRRGALVLKVVLACVILLITVVAQIRSRNIIDVLNTDTRASIQLLKDKASDGDIVVGLDNYITLFYYYMGRAPGAKHLAVLAYPPELAIHPGWYNEQLTLKDRDAYVSATRAYVAERRGELAANPGRRLWLIDTSWNPETTRIVTGVFDSALRRVESITVTGGTGYTEYIAYEAPQ
jgi:mannosyltransferase